jgi:hypothetical protein
MPGVRFGNVKTTGRDMPDNRLLSLIEAAKVLDNPAVTQEQCNQVSQYCSILAQSLDPDMDCHYGDYRYDWPSPDLEAAFTLALTTNNYASSLSWPDTSDWWRDYKKRMLDEWADARRFAEMTAHGSIAASTVLALDQAERRAEGQTAVVATDDDTAEPQSEEVVFTGGDDGNMPPLLSAATFQEWFERGLTGVPSQEPGHSPLYPNPGPLPL